jgi:hypothetical protein
MESSYRLHCLVSGNTSSDIFSVDIGRTQTVWDLKELIKETNKHAFRDVDAHRLQLWNVSYLMPTIGC